MDLEHAAQELADAERLRATKDARMRELIQAELVNRERMRIAELLTVRGELRETLLLPEKVTRG